jgi:hypothetical protein
MLEKLYTNSSLYYLSLIKQTDGSGCSHHHCTESACTTNNIDRETYLSVHTNSSCERKLIGPTENDIHDSINRGGFPLISFQDDKLEVIHSELKSSPEYVAISHVWSDDMGNLNGNKLPLCQIQRLHVMVVNLRKKSGPCFFWMDTLCVSWKNDEQNRRRKAIGRMRETYENATDVLVVSNDFTNTLSDIVPVEVLLRIACSVWMRRLWTLQEGVLAQRLHFQFSNRALNFTALKASMTERTCSSFDPVKSEALQCGYHFKKFKEA